MVRGVTRELKWLLSHKGGEPSSHLRSSRHGHRHRHRHITEDKEEQAETVNEAAPSEYQVHRPTWAVDALMREASIDLTYRTQSIQTQSIRRYSITPDFSHLRAHEIFRKPDEALSFKWLTWAFHPRFTIPPPKVTRLGFALDGDRLWVYVVEAQAFDRTRQALVSQRWIPFDSFMMSTWTALISEKCRVYPDPSYL